ncbi:increased rdna silencing protein 4 [Acrodontium crateriforme]|uniref:Increased rdna silencing protein 4 n=1 Tax=Acrodontium crateriforme TaxID=150365 RepID=A0AAQ3M6S7_9PEZI|nr:increased rdna silencing protein 4 [Acrodontium crateriforme]
MPASRASSRASVRSAGVGPKDVDAQATALVGAIQAFGRQPPKPLSTSSTGSGSNGALAAAAWAGKSPVPVTLARPTGNKPQPTRTVSPLSAKPESLPKLSPPVQGSTNRSKSPSTHAAHVAAERSPGLLDTDSSKSRIQKDGQREISPPEQQTQKKDNRRLGQDERPDSTPIPTTTSLVNLFERSSSIRRTGFTKTPEPILIKPHRDVPIQSPKPVRMQEAGITSVFKMELEEDAKTPTTSRNTAAKDFALSTQADGAHSPRPYISSIAGSGATSTPITIRKRPSQMIDTVTAMSSPSSSSPANRLRPSPSPLRNPSVDLSSTSRSPTRSITSPPHILSTSQMSGHSLTSQYNQLYPRRRAPLNDESALANAIVASSLASSRAPSPKRLEPPPVPTRRRNHTFSFSRTPSPSKPGMRHTLRKADESESESSEDENHPYGKHKKKRHLRKHPNKHHEGDRKRWRDAVTERERRRYEGVWAANKGIHCSLMAEEEQALRTKSKSDNSRAVNEAVANSVSSIVARDIWNRSRLPETVLETVWDLVDIDGVGRLSKDEFVVGMWLIDQRLKGRKLPVKVSASVWASVRNLQGIKIRK